MVRKAAAPDIGPRRSWQTAAPAARIGARGGRREPLEEWAGRPAVRECRSISDRHPAVAEGSGQEAEDPQRNQRNHAGTLIAFMRSHFDPAIRRSGDPAIRRSGDPAIRRSGDCTEASRLSTCQAPRGTISHAPGAHAQNCRHYRPCSPDRRYGLSPPISNCSHPATVPLPKEEIHLGVPRRMDGRPGLVPEAGHKAGHNKCRCPVPLFPSNRAIRCSSQAAACRSAPSSLRPPSATPRPLSCRRRSKTAPGC